MHLVDMEYFTVKSFISTFLEMGFLFRVSLEHHAHNSV